MGGSLTPFFLHESVRHELTAISYEFILYQKIAASYNTFQMYVFYN